MEQKKSEKNSSLEYSIQKKVGPKTKGIAFVFSNWVEKDNVNELNQESKERLDKAIELYQKGMISYILVCGGEFIEGLTQPVAKMMTDYLISRRIPQEAIIEERRSKDTTSNVRFGKFIVKLKKLDDLPLYYVSSGYHLERIKTIVDGQGKGRADDTYISSGRDKIMGTKRIAELLLQLINKHDPKGESALAKFMRHKRSYPIKKPDNNVK